MTRDRPERIMGRWRVRTSQLIVGEVLLRGRF